MDATHLRSVLVPHSTAVAIAFSSVRKSIRRVIALLVCMPGLFGTSAFPQAPATPTSNVSSAGQQQEYVTGIPTRETGTEISSNIDTVSGTLSLPKARALLDATVCEGTAAQASCALDDSQTYALINVVLWSDRDASSGKQSVKSTNWYIYNSSKHWSQAEYSGTNRLFGAKKIVFLYIHLHAYVDAASPYQVNYELQITKRQSTNVAALMQLAQIVIPATPANAAGITPPPTFYNVWGGRAISVGYRTSDIVVSSSLIEGAATVSLVPSVTLINEAKQYWDVSIAVPIKKISALQYNSTNGTITPSQINEQHVFAVGELYLPPVDLASGTPYSLVPHAIVGVSMAQQPLHSILTAGAIGFHGTEVYAGAIFVKQQTLSGLSPGGTATQQQLTMGTRQTFKAQFSVGLNIPIVAAYKSLTKSKTTTK
jgi:hypothetical protein